MNEKSLFLALVLAPLLASCELPPMLSSFEKKAATINRYEQTSLFLAKENRELRAEIKRLEFEVQKLKQDNAFANKKINSLAMESQGGSRGIASVRAIDFNVKKDQVEFSTYKWSAEDMLKIADKEFKSKNFEKAAQFYTSIVNHYPDFKQLNDEFYYKAGVSAYETGAHHDWTLTHFNVLMEKYPTSKHFRSAKLWVGLTHMKMGEKQKFFAAVEEFRKKYRNTKEWKILSSYYEQIEEKTNE